MHTLEASWEWQATMQDTSGQQGYGLHVFAVRCHPVGLHLSMCSKNASHTLDNLTAMDGPACLLCSVLVQLTETDTLCCRRRERGARLVRSRWVKDTQS